MDSKDIEREFKCFGSMTVGLKGQVVIPANARKELDINNGDTLLAFKAPHRQGLVLIKADAMKQVLTMMGERLAHFEKLVKDHKVAGSGQEKEEG
ncbi:MAG: AbrB/MazE/SpoVT family DNA-binding domain-containing protein [Dehalococcoidales bacterium]|nr:AbrB/MazE/SpoVT family DNA-binding domain-containing protein [Dehalococcoidales bacterium]